MSQNVQRAMGLSSNPPNWLCRCRSARTAPTFAPTTSMTSARPPKAATGYVRCPEVRCRLHWWIDRFGDGQTSRSCTDCGDVKLIKQFPEHKPHSVFERVFSVKWGVNSTSLVRFVKTAFLNLVIHGCALRVAVIDVPNLIRNRACQMLELWVAVVFELVLKSGLSALPSVLSQNERIVHQFMAYPPGDHFLAVLLDSARGDTDLHCILRKFLSRVLKTHACKRRHMPVQNQFRWW